MPKLLAVDPGPEYSAYVQFGQDGVKPEVFGKVPNDEFIFSIVPGLGASSAVIEMVACYGMPAGKELFETCVIIGRFMEILDRRNIAVERMTRVEVKQRLCHRTAGVNDAVIRQRMIDIYGPEKEKAIGNKAKPGPLFGVKADIWAALALGVAYQIKLKEAD